MHDRYHDHQFYQCESEINAFHTAILFLFGSTPFPYTYTRL